MPFFASTDEAATPEWFVPRRVILLVLLLSVVGCGNDRLRLGPPDRGPVDLTTTNLIVFDNAQGIIEQLPRVSP